MICFFFNISVIRSRSTTNCIENCNRELTKRKVKKRKLRHKKSNSILLVWSNQSLKALPCGALGKRKHRRQPSFLEIFRIKNQNKTSPIAGWNLFIKIMIQKKLGVKVYYCRSACVITDCANSLSSQFALAASIRRLGC